MTHTPDHDPEARAARPADSGASRELATRVLEPERRARTAGTRRSPWPLLAAALLVSGLSTGAVAALRATHGPRALDAGGTPVPGAAALASQAPQGGQATPGSRPAAPAANQAAGAPATQDPGAPADPQAARQAVFEGFREQGLRIDLEQGWVALDARVLSRYQPLEYVLVGPRGQGHESLFGTEVQPSALNAALLLLGTEAGQNARWIELPPDADEREASPNDGQGGPGDGAAPPAAPEDGAAPELGEAGAGEQPPAPSDALPRRPRYRIELPSGDGLYLYAGWRAEGEVYFFRVEDLLANVRQERAMRRHRFVFLGSRWIEPKPGAQPAFAADLEHNLINLVFFSAGHTLLTCAVREAEDEEAWFANPWLLPESDQPVLFLLSRRPLQSPPAALSPHFPESLFPAEEP